MQKFIIALAFLLLLCNDGFTQKKKQAQPLDGLDEQINQILKDWNAAGAAVAVVEKDKVIYLKGFGYKDYENKQPVTPNTLFAIGSCTKAFTATLLGILEKEGRLNLDEPVNEYLPGLKFYNEYLTAHVSARDMMTHRTGLPRHDLSWYGADVSRDSLLRRIRHLQPSAGLRETYQYNNFMFLAQGMLAEKIENKSWEQQVKEKIFMPLGMNGANFSINDLEKAPDFSLGYTLSKDSILKLPYMNIDPIGPAGSINASAADMAKWVMAWVNGGKLNEKEIIPSSFYYQAITSQMAVRGGLPNKEKPGLHLSTIGLGWFLSSYNGHYRVEHGGNIDGFSATTSFFPTDSIGIVVLVNQNGSMVPSVIRNTISDRLLKLPAYNWSKNLKKETEEQRKLQSEQQNLDSINQKQGTSPSHQLPDFAGNYFHPGYGIIKIDFTNDTLFLKYNSFKENVYLKHYHYDVFKIQFPGTENSGQSMKLQFITGLNGEVASIKAKLEQAIDPIEFEKQTAAKILSKEELQVYTGNYDISGVDIKVYIKGENTLMVLVPGQPDYELIPVKDDEFDFKTLKGYKLKFEKKEGKVTAMEFVQPNGIFKAIKKQ